LNFPAAPREYLVPRRTGSLTIDGRLGEAAWARARWTASFIDIEGSIRPAPRFRTRVKMLWDDQYWYIAAQMEEPDLWATIRERDPAARSKWEVVTCYPGLHALEDAGILFVEERRGAAAEREEQEHHRLAADDARGLGKAGLGVELWRGQDEHRLSAPEGRSQACRIVHLGQGDVAAPSSPLRRLGLVAQNGADGQSFSEQAARNRAADLAGDSGDCVHDGSPEG